MSRGPGQGSEGSAISTIISYKFQAEAGSFLSTVTQIESRLNALQRSAPAAGKMLDGAFGTGKGADALIKDVHRAESAFQGMHASASKVGSAIQGVFMGIGNALATKGLEAVGGAFGAVKGAVIDMNATLETSKISWGVLLGSTGAAEAKLKDLYGFAAKTPFDFPEVEKASRLLETFGGAALNTGDNMTLIGDIAAGVGQPFGDVAMWTGRMYDAFQSGKPFGESAARLQEMGAMSGTTRTKLEEMQKAGASSAEMWAAFSNEMGRFGGMMDKQSSSFSGRMATMQDTLTQLAATAGKPIFDMMSSALGVLLDENHLGSPKVAEFATALSTKLAVGIQSAITGIGSFVSSLVPVGRYLVEALRYGDSLNDWLVGVPAGVKPIVQGFGFLVEAVRDFGRAIGPAFDFIRSGNIADAMNAFDGLYKLIVSYFGEGAGAVLWAGLSGLVHGIQTVRDTIITVKQAFAGEWVSDASIQPVVRFFGETALRIRNEVIPALLDFGRRLGEAGQSFAAIFTPERVAILQQFARDLTGASQETSTLGIAFKVLSTVLPPVVEGMGKLVGILVDGLGWLQKTGYEAEVLKVALGGIGAWIALGQLIGLGKQLAEVATQAKAAADTLLSVPKAIISTVKTVYEKAGEAAQTGGDIARTVTTTIKTAWGTAQDAIIWAQLYGEQAKTGITKAVSAVWDKIPEPQWPNLTPPTLKTTWEVPTPTLPTLTAPTLKSTWEIPTPTLPAITMPALKPTWDISMPTLPAITMPAIKPSIDMNLDFGKIASGFAAGMAGALGAAMASGTIAASVTTGLAAVFSSPLLLPAIGIALAAVAIGAFAYFVKGWVDQYPSFGAAMGDLFGNIIPTALGAAAAGLVNAGMFLIDKILTGITTAAPKIFDFITNNWPALLIVAINSVFGPIPALVATALGLILPIVMEKGREIGDAIGTAFSAIGTTVSTTLSTIGSTVGTAFSTIGTAIQSALSTIGSTVGTAFSSIGTTIQGAMESARGIVTSAWDNIIGILASAKDRIIQAIQAAFQPVGQIISSIMSGDWAGALRAGLDLLYNVFVDLPGRLLSIVGDAFRGVLGVISSTGQEIAALAKTTWDTVTSTIGTALSTVGTTVGTAFSTIGTTISGAMDTIKTTIQGAWDTITSAIGTAWSSIGTAVTTGIDAIITKAGAFKDQVVGTFQAAWDAVTSAVGTFFQAFGTSFANHLDQDLLAKITAWKDAAVARFNEFTSAVTSTFTGWWESISSGFTTFTGNLTAKAGEIKTGITTAITDMASSATAAFTNWFTSVVTDIGQFVSNVGNKIGELKTGVTTAITDMASSATSAFTNWFQTTATNVAQFVTDIGTKIGNLKDTVVNGVKEMATSSMSEFTTWVTNVVGKVSQLGTDVASKMREIGGNITSAILKPFEAVADGIPKALGGIGGMIGSALKPVADVLNTFGSGVVGIINGIGSKFGAPALSWNHISLPGLQTGHGNFQGGPAIVGEQGPELGIVNGKPTMLGAHGPELTTLPKSAIVLPAHVTKSLLASGVPGFEAGLNLDSLKTFFTGAPDKIIQMALDAAGIKGPGLPGEMGSFAPAIMGTVKNWMVDWLKKFLKTALPVGPESVQTGIAFAEAQVGKPYIWGGGHGNWSDINAPGWDCSGFVSAVLRSMGISNPNGIVTDFYNWMTAGKTGVVDIGTNNATNPDPTIQHMGIALMGQQYESGGPFGGVGKNGTNFAEWGHPPGGGSIENAKGGNDPAALSWNNILSGRVKGQWQGPNSVPPLGTLFDMLEAKPALFTETNVMRIADTLPKFAAGDVITDPTIGLIGEGGQTEIVTPEPLLRSIIRDESGRGLSGAGMAASIQPVIGDTGRMLAGPGKDLLSGFMRGAQQQMPKVEKFFADLTNSIPEWKGPQSRDLLLLYASGQWVIEGFVAGMDSKILDVAKKAADVSQSVSKAIMDGIQALNGLRTIELPGGEKTSVFFEGLNSIVQGFVDSASRFETDGLKAGVIYAEAAGKISGMVKTGSEALGSLVDFIRPSDEKIGDFKFAVEHLVRSFGDSAKYLDVELMAGAVIFSEAATAAVGVVKDGAGAMTKLVDFIRPSDQAIGDFKFAVEKLVKSFGESAQAMDPALLEYAKTFAEAADKSVGIVEKGAKGLATLNTFIRPTDAAIGDFKFAVQKLVESFGDSARAMDPGLLDHANTFSETAGKSVEIVGKGVEGLAKLTGFIRPSDQVIADFKFAVERLVTSFGDSARAMDPGLLGHASTFSETAIKSLALLGTGVEGLMKLGTFLKPSDQSIADFKFSVQNLVQALGDSAERMKSDFLAHTNEFTTTATNGLKILGEGVKAFESLKDFARPTDQSIFDFREAVRKLVGELGNAALTMTNEFLQHATLFTTSAGSAMGILKTGVEGMAELETFRRPSAEAVDAFLGAVAYVVRKLGESADQMTTEGIAKIQSFATSANTALGLAKTGGEAFVAIAQTTPPSQAAIDAFLAGVVYVVTKIGETAMKMESEGIAKIQAFATAANTCLTTAKTGTEAFKGMAELKAPSSQAIDELLNAINYVVQKIGETASRMETEGIAKIQAFAAAAKSCLEVTKTGVDAFKGMADLKAPSAQAIDTLVGAIVYVVQKLNEVATNIGTEGLNKAKDFARDLVQIYENIKTAITTFEQIKAFEGKATEMMNILARDTAGALEHAKEMSRDSHLIKDDAGYYASDMRDAFRLFQEGDSYRNSIPANAGKNTAPTGPPLPAAPGPTSLPASWGGGAGSIPKMAAGGIVTRPTFALVGEAGPEAVIPLRQFRGGDIRPLPNMGAARRGDDGGTVVHLDAPITIYTQSGDPAEIDRAVRRGLRRAVGELQAGG